MNAAAGNLQEGHRLLAESSGNLWIVGVVLVLAGSISQNLGNNLASLAYSTNDDEEGEGDGDKEESGKVEGEKDMDGEGDKDGEEKELSFWEKNLWAVGTATFVGGSLMTFVAFGFAAQSLLASLESVQFVSNIIFAKLVHKEEITYKMMLATFGIVCGNTLVVLFSTHGATKYSGEDIFDIWRSNTSFHIYLGVMGGVSLACEYVYRTYNASRMVDRKLLPFHSFAEPGCYCVSSAFVGSFAVVNAKCIAMFLAGDAAAEFQAAPMWTVLITWIVVVAFWLKRMDQGLELFPPLFFIPTLMAFFIFFSIICGGIFFEEFNSFTGAQFGGFFSGVFCILLGVFFLAPTNEFEVGPPLVEEKTAVSKSKSIRRLSFSAIVDDEATGASGRASEGASNRPKARSRASTMSHPLAALKEAHHRASQIQFVADFENSVQETTNHTMRRASVALGFLSEGDEDTKAAEQSGALESLTSDHDDEEAPVAAA
jgi:hypothetical protein